MRAGGRIVWGAAAVTDKKTAGPGVPAWRAAGPARNVALLALAALGLAAVLYAVIPASPGGRATAAKGPRATAAAAPHGGTAAGQPALAGTPAGGTPAAALGPGALKPSRPAQASSWNAGPGGKALAGVTTLASNALMAHAIRQYPQMLQYCRALAGAVQGAEAGPPITDAAMQKMYLKSLTAFRQGTADCVAGITQHSQGVEESTTHVNTAVLNRAVSELSLGNQDLYIATEALRKQ